MIKSLLAIRLRSLFNSMSGKNKEGKRASFAKRILLAVLFAYLALVFIGISTLMAVGMAMYMLPLEMDAMYFGVFMLATFSIIFFLSIFETKSDLFECKDNELLLAMPIRPSDIVVSRMLMILIYNYAEAAIVMIPAIVVYAIFGGSITGILGGVLALLLLPLLASALSSAVGYAVAFVSARMKNKTFVTTIISLIFMAAYFVLYFGLLGNMSESGEELMIVIPEIPAISAIGSAALLSPIPLALLALASLGSSYLAYRIISENYISIVTKNRGAARTEYKAKRLEKRTTLASLSAKELRRFFSSSVYILNGGAGLIFLVIISVMLFANRTSLSELALALEIPSAILGNMLAPVIAAALTLCCGTTTISASALSLEGKSLWVIKSMPISSRDVILAKAFPHVVVTTPPTILASVIACITLAPSPIHCFFIIAIPAVSNVAFALFGIVINVAFPKLEFENETQPVKQSLAVFLAMAIPSILGVALSAGSFILAMMDMSLIASLASFLLICGLAVALYFIAIGPAAKKYERL